MNCCDDYGNCKQGPGCPVREAVEQQDNPLLTLDMAIRWVHGFLAFVGVVALSAGIGLYHAGFFNWLFNLKG